MKPISYFCVICLLLVAGCSAFPGAFTPPAQAETPASQATASPSPSPQATLETATSAPTPATVTLRVWLPAEFDPDAGSQAGELLEARLQEFTSRRSNINVEYRIKDLEGPGGIIDTLTTAAAAAPLALPDLVALPRPVLETAVLKGLLFPFDPYTNLDGSDWFEYARQLGRLQDNTFGLPFAGDVLVLYYQPTFINEPPALWDDLLELQAPLLFPAADRRALFTLSQYLALDGPVQDEEGRPTLDVAILTIVLQFFEQAHTGGQMPFWLTQFETDDQVWQAYTEERSPLAANWISYYLTAEPENVLIAPLLASRDEFTFATGWVWSLANPDPQRQAMAVQLATFLTLGDFTARWTEAAGYLPPRASSISTWRDAPSQATANRVISAAQVYPAADVLNTIGPILQEATTLVLKEQTDAATAAQQAAEQLTTP